MTLYSSLLYFNKTGSDQNNIFFTFIIRRSEFRAFLFFQKEMADRKKYKN